jgi:hypothetical protein
MRKMCSISPKAEILLGHLRNNVEGYSETDEAGYEWRSVCLDNARHEGLSRRSFAGHLSALQAAGFYKSQGDDCFGLVRMA